jgi:isopentenyldiphosphate isomerase
MAHPPIAIVNEKDEVIGSAMLPDAWRDGLIHRIVRVLVEDEQGRLLLQRRSPQMGLFSNCWGESSAGHVDEGEGYLEAAKREMAEEIGLSGIELEEVATYRTSGVYEGRKLNRFNRLYKARVPSDIKINFSPEEVSEVQWLTRPQLEDLLANHPDQITNELEQVVHKYYNAGNEDNGDPAAGQKG